MHDAPIRLQYLHLYRSLLRSAGYLADPAARAYISSHVRFRFRRTRSRTPPIALGDPVVSTSRPLATVRRGAVILQRAADGDVSALRKVLCLTYARVGRRRRQLLTALREEAAHVGKPDDRTSIDAAARAGAPRDGSPSIPASKAASDDIAASPCNALVPALLATSPNNKLDALIQANVMHQSRLKIRKKLSVQPVIPAQNIWARPMPLRRRRNIEKRWLAQTLEHIHVPVPEAQWRQLEAFALGKTEVPCTVPRRRRAQKDGLCLEGPEDLVSFLLAPARSSEPKHALVHDTHSGLLTLRKKETSAVITTSRRGLRRLYADIWRSTPMMQWNALESKWKVKWGFEHVRDLPVLEAGHLELLDPGKTPVESIAT